MKILSVFLTLSFLMLSSCITGPKVEHKSALDVLGADSYESTPGRPEGSAMPPAIPANLKQKNRLTRIEGHVRTSDKIPLAVKYVKVQLLNDDNQRYAEFNTDMNGYFILAGIIPNGHYVIKVISGQYQGALPIYVYSYDMEGIVVTAEPVQ